MVRTTRRQFVARAGALAGALTLGPAAASSLAAAAPPVLTGSRRRVYHALVESVVTEPPMRLPAASAHGAAAEFAAAYAEWPAEQRRLANEVLDALERGPGRPFSTLDRASRAAYLRAASHPSTDAPVGAEQQRILLTERAMGLVATTVGSPDVPQAITV